MFKINFDRFCKGEKVKIKFGILEGHEATVYLTPTDLKTKVRGYGNADAKKLYVVLLGIKGYGHDCGGLVKTGNGWFVTESSLEYTSE